jgi:hypothetical protein
MHLKSYTDVLSETFYKIVVDLVSTLADSVPFMEGL